jgi:ABC-type proline/glycine betaine transport system permease subunit
METLLSFFSNIDWYEIWLASIDTLIMLGGSLLFTVLLGLPLGILLFLCSPRQLLEQKALYSALSFVVNILRSLPFIILLIVMIPFTCPDYRHLAGRRRCDSAVGRGGHAVLCAPGRNGVSGSGPRHHRSHPGNGRQHASDHYQCVAA